MKQVLDYPQSSESARQALRYVLITPARNEAAFIELTLKSVTAQTVKPLRWIIVSDGSTDGTDEIVKRYAADYQWIELLRTPERKERHFAGKVMAFNAGYARVKHLEYDIIGNLDADISFEEGYMEFLLGKFGSNLTLGVAGTPFSEDGKTYDYRFTNVEHVSGACQLFRRECFENVGGYTAVRGGGIDWLAVTSARMKGWQTRSFTEKVCLHHKKTQDVKHRNLTGSFKYGYQEYVLGGHPVWQIFRAVYQMSKKPLILGGGSLLVGYLWAMVKRPEKPITREFEAFVRREQLRRLRQFFARTLSFGKAGPGARGAL
jgi:glycosyltransferase involved in cell wall biosynthesis